ncbi:Zn-binding Pro-Ala-Ala-Arg (PAAR) domain-containing protein, incolved in TypeVI secretion [Pseudomonas sp. 8BK]|uniref:PAAR domain-containing protein n=1 Tax=Pseudomonas sp. 8BK TaxID=2653164 RepID=UPI0012F2A1B1|nr:PAAR domain-containing protein [Pseudomonas sp. 8BK]VXB37035.1 Zn-binding Pro-Ala-Ala-Arg (PAAR) domain-containing protein, incolved in TypeVI secretion [Pseudomonas sp. 8BK]
MSGKPAARVSDPTVCPLPGHSKNPITVGSPNVLFDNLSAARQDDPTACGSSLASNVISNVLINGKPATTVGTVGNHGNPVVAGSGTVIIGTSGGGAAFTAPAPLTIAEGFDRLFSLEAEGGQPLKGLAYRIVSESGITKQGSTAEAGITGSIYTGGKKEALTLYISGED